MALRVDTGLNVLHGMQPPPLADQPKPGWNPGLREHSFVSASVTTGLWLIAGGERHFCPATGNEDTGVETLFLFCYT